MKFAVNIFDNLFVEMKINRNVLSLSGRNTGRISLPRNLKKAWPDRNNYSSVSYNETFSFNVNIAPVLRDLENPRIPKCAKILDIGAFKNEVVETLQAEGFHNAVGIDVNPRILKSKYGMQINFRDLPLKDKYAVVYFNHVLGHFPGGMFNSLPEPSLQLFANKIYLHLLPKGYLLFCDSADNVPQFNECLLNIGFKHFLEHKEYFHIFQKP